MANVVTNEVLTARTFVEYYCGKYFYHLDTFKEMKQALISERIFPSEWSLVDTDKIPKDAYVVLVQFSKEKDYTEYEYRWMRVLKKDLKKFRERMEEEMEAAE